MLFKLLFFLILDQIKDSEWFVSRFFYPNAIKIKRVIVTLNYV